MENYTIELLEKGKRVDGRSFDQFRKIEIKTGIIKKAEGSALVKMGETEVMAGVKLDITQPFPDSPEHGVLSVSAEFTPLASPDFELGPPGEDAIELARIVDRGIRESKAIELEKICLEPGKMVWGVFIDIHILNHHGNLLDASALASVAALLNTKIPRLEGDKIVRGEFEKSLPVVFKPINISVAKIKERFLVDPNFEEENVINAKLAVCVRDDDKICSIQKQGNEELSPEDIEKMIEMAIEKSKEIRELVIL
ncbi:MAG: exosome complex protein Rrp42 [Candidatus Aenigmatarchaeota archaeon]